MCLCVYEGGGGGYSRSEVNFGFGFRAMMHYDSNDGVVAICENFSENVKRDSIKKIRKRDDSEEKSSM